MAFCTGIVLQHSLPYKRRVSLLDKNLGRIDGIVFHDNIMLGSLVQYDAQSKHNTYLIKDMTIEDAPFALARCDILFLHHILEICYHLVPVGSCVDGVFDLLSQLYDKNNESISAQ